MATILAVTALLLPAQNIGWLTLAQLAALSLAAALTLWLRRHGRAAGRKALEQRAWNLPEARRPVEAVHAGKRRMQPRGADIAPDPHQAPSPTPHGLAPPLDTQQRHLDMNLIREACVATNMTGYKLLLDQLMLDESRRLFRLCILLDTSVSDGLTPAARSVQAHAARLGLTELARVCQDITSSDSAMSAATRHRLSDRLKLAIRTSHALAASMALVSAPCPPLPAR